MKEILQSIADRIISADDRGVTPRDLNVADGILSYMHLMPAHTRRAVTQLIWLFEYLPPVIILKPRRFSRLGPRDQDRYIEAWGTSRLGLLRTGFRVLKTLALSTYYQNSASWKAIGHMEE